MKKALLLYLALFSAQAFATDECFIALQNGKTIEQIGKCDKRHPPLSTFKMPLALIANNEGIILNEVNPTLDMEDEFDGWIPLWQVPSSILTFVENSCAWYWQTINKALKPEVIQTYINQFSYGNTNLQTDKTSKENYCNLPNLQVSPLEQVEFVQNLVSNKLPVSMDAKKMVQNLLYLDRFEHNWELYGQTSSGNIKNSDGEKTGQFGWFVGWLAKDNKQIPFVYYTDQGDGWLAAKMAKKKLHSIVNAIELTKN